MHEDQVEASPTLAAELIATQFPALAGEPVIPVEGGGTDNRIFRIGVTHAARFPLLPGTPMEQLGHLFDAPARSVFREAPDCGDLEWARGRAWALEQALGAAWYYQGSNPAMHELGISTLRRVLDA